MFFICCATSHLPLVFIFIDSDIVSIQSRTPSCLRTCVLSMTKWRKSARRYWSGCKASTTTAPQRACSAAWWYVCMCYYSLFACLRMLMLVRVRVAPACVCVCVCVRIMLPFGARVLIFTVCGVGCARVWVCIENDVLAIYLFIGFLSFPSFSFPFLSFPFVSFTSLRFLSFPFGSLPFLSFPSFLF